MLPKSYLMLSLKSSIFYQNKPKIKLVLQKENFSGAGGRALAELPDPQIQLFSSLQISDYTPNTRRVVLILPNSRILQWKVFELAKLQPISTAIK